MSNTIDLNTPPANHDLRVSVERAESLAERNVRLFKEVMLFLAALAFVAILLWLCVDALTAPGTDPESKKWAMSILSGIAGGLVGYLVRR